MNFTLAIIISCTNNVSRDYNHCQIQFYNIMLQSSCLETDNFNVYPSGPSCSKHRLLYELVKRSMR